MVGARIAAVLAPILLVGAWFAWLSSQGEQWPPSQLALDMDAQLAEEKPEVVILGNSASFHAVDPDQLAKELGLSGKVSRLFVPASRSPSWYAVLKNRVLAQPHKPKLVVVVASLHHMIDLEMNEQRIGRLRGLLTAEDQMVRERVLGAGAWPTVERSRELSDSLLEIPKQAAVGLLFQDEAGADEPLLARGQRIAAAASEVVFNLESGTDMSLHRRILPVAQREQAAIDATAEFNPEAAFLADIADLAASQGVRVVFTWFPLPASNPAPNPGVDLQRRTIELVNAHGAGWIDLHALPLSQSVFFDHIHMNEAGRRQFTEALAEELKRIDALGTGPFGPAALPIEIGPVTVIGTPAPLPELGPPAKTNTACRYQHRLPQFDALNNKALYDSVGLVEGSPLRLLADGVPLRPHIKTPDQACDDTFTHGPTGLVFSPAQDQLDARTWTLAWASEAPIRSLRKGNPSEAWWVMPGTTLQIELPEAWPSERGAFAVRVDGRQFGDGGDYRLKVGAHEQALETIGGLARVLVLPEAPTGPWTVQLSASPTSAPLYLERITVGQGPGAATLIGAPAASQSTRLLGVSHPGRSVHTSSPVPPGSGPGQPRRIDRPEPTPVARVAVGPLAGLGPGDVYAATTAGSCSPIRLLEDGVPLAVPHTGIKDIVGGTPGAYRVQGATAMFTSSDLSDPATNGRRYEAVLSEDRACGQAVWVYPGDTVELMFDPARLSPLGASRLLLSGAAFLVEPAGHTISVQALGDDLPYLDAQVPLTELASGLASVALSQPLPGTVQRLILRLQTSAEAPYVILTSAELEGDDELAPADGSAPPPAAPAAAGLTAPVELPIGQLGPIRDDPRNVQWIESDKGGSTAELRTEGGVRFVRLISAAFGASRICSQLFPAGAGTARLKLRAPKIGTEPGVKHSALRAEVLWRDAAGKPVQGGDQVLIEPRADWDLTQLGFEPPPGAARGQLCLRFARSTGQADLAAWRVVPPGQ